MRKNLLVLALVLVASAIEPVRAHADDGPGAFVLRLSAEVLGWQNDTFGPSGAPTATSRELLRFGLLQPRLGLELGGVVTPEIALGVLGSVARDEWTTTSGYGGPPIVQTSLTWIAAGWLEVALLPGEGIRPYARATLGASGWESTATATAGGSVAQFVITAAIGAHLFASDDVSIDPWLELAYRRGTRSGASLIVPDGVDAESIGVSLGVSVTGWIGGASAPDATDDAAPSSPIAARPEAPQRRARMEGTLLRDEVPIAGVASAQLESEPRTNGRDVQLALQVISREPRFAGCTEATVASVTGEAVAPVRVTAEPFHSGVQETVVVRATPAHIERLVGRDARIVICGTTFSLDPRGRAAIHAFVQQHRRVARVAGTLEQESAVDSEGPEAETETETGTETETETETGTETAPQP